MPSISVDPSVDDQSVKQTPKWLKRIQQNSWEAEILVSGGAVFTLFQISDYLAQQKVFFGDNFPFAGLDQAIIFAMLAVKGVTFSFILHLLVRGIWISMVCLNGSFPRGIISDKLRISSRFSGSGEDPTLTPQIIKLDRLSGLVFYSGFVYVLLIIGFVTAVFGVVFTFQLVPFLRYPLLIAIVIFYADLLFSGWPLRRYPVLGKLYFPVYWLFNYLTLAFLFRKTLHVLFTNVSRLHAAAFISLFLFASFYLSYLSLYKVLHIKSPFEGHAFAATHLNAGVISADGFYLNKISAENNIRWFAIESEVVERKWLKVFVNYRPNYDDGISDKGGKSFSDIVFFTIDQDTVRNLDWINHTRSVANQHGIMSMIDISRLAQGKHIITLFIEDDYYTRIKPISVPFWKE
ncbi:MAG TPA: hypothetical protein VGD65_10895 [Chryseosolibacter sp.]